MSYGNEIARYMNIDGSLPILSLAPGLNGSPGVLMLVSSQPIFKCTLLHPFLFADALLSRTSATINESLTYRSLLRSLLHCIPQLGPFLSADALLPRPKNVSDCKHH